MTEIADKLAAALRNYPCKCRKAGEWPAFANDSKVSECVRCTALALYDAQKAIVQTPEVAAEMAKRGKL